MEVRAQAFAGEADLRAMEALARRESDCTFHAGELPYRFCSWALDDAQNGRLWRAGDGRLLAWAVLQLPMQTIDLACEPEVEDALVAEILAWVDERSQAHPELVPLGTPEGKPCWFAHVFADQAGRIRLLEAAGFADQSDVGEYSWSKVFMERGAELPVKDYRIPAGFVVRPLAGEAEIEGYVRLHREVFGSRNMTAAWRQRTLRHPDHVPDLDLVVAAPDGRLAAFCIGWLDRHVSEPVGDIEPLGCHPEFTRYALGRIALAECLRRMRAQGAVKIVVETDNWRDTAFQLYESLGFQVKRQVLVYRKDY